VDETTLLIFTMVYPDFTMLYVLSYHAVNVKIAICFIS